MQDRSLEEVEGYITRALEIAQLGTIDGAHHKNWVIDQMVRALTGCPVTEEKATDAHGQSYTYEAIGKSAAYTAFTEDIGGPECWDEGIAP